MSSQVLRFYTMHSPNPNAEPADSRIRKIRYLAGSRQSSLDEAQCVRTMSHLTHSS